MKATFFLIFSGLLMTGIAHAQDAAVTDDELKRYATAMDSVNELTASLKTLITDMVRSSKVMTGARYNELSKIIADEAKLAEAKATEEEIAFVKQVAAKRDEETAKINQAFQTLAKDFVGAAVYNKVKKALASDAALKEKYDALMSELAKDNPGS
jgi:ABC-type ATPase with predicted acetyltransferase domain